MKLNEVDGAAVRREIKRIKDEGASEFRTRDVSDKVMADHGCGPADYPFNYHAIIGTYLSMHDAALGISCPNKQAKHKRGVLWSFVR